MPTDSVSNQGRIDRIISVTEQITQSSTIINITGNGKIIDYVTKANKIPPLIIIDIFSKKASLKSTNINPKSPLLKKIRIGYHSDKIRVVLEFKSKDIPASTYKIHNNRLTISLISKNEIKAITEEKDKEEKEKSVKTPVIQNRKTISVLDKLTEIDADDYNEDAANFSKGVDAFKTQNWSVAFEKFDHIIKTFPESSYVERAYFLLAKSYNNLYSQSISDKLTEIRDHYEKAVNKFPKSPYAPDALLSLGNLCLKTKNYYEAMALYNLVLKEHANSPEIPKTLLQKAKILSLKKREKEAIATLENIINTYPGSAVEIPAKIELAKIAYERNSFHESLNIISELIKTTPENIYTYPEISLYLGHNYFQLADTRKARENLLRFYNCCPDNIDNHLILSKIGDSYRNEGLERDAEKFYYLTIKHYPETQGSLISKIRLAKQYDEGKIDLKIIQDIGSQDIGSPEEIYKGIINNSPDNNMRKSLAHLAMLKLAILYSKEKDYYKSIDTLKEFLKRYPLSTLKNEAYHTLNNVLTEFFKEKLNEKQYITIINIYQKEKNLILKINSPDLFLNIARAFKHLNLDAMAVEMFKKADYLLSDSEKPQDLIYILSHEMFEQKKFTKALEMLNLFTEKYPDSKLTPYAYQLKGKTYLRHEKYKQAEEEFSIALKYNLSPCDMADILADKAMALIKGKSNEKALSAIRKANALKEDCKSDSKGIYFKIGDLFMLTGHIEDAISVFNQALEAEKIEENKILLKLRIAKCHRLLNKKDDSIALYEQVARLDHPFWSRVAKNRMEEIDFYKEIKGKKTE